VTLLRQKYPKAFAKALPATFDKVKKQTCLQLQSIYKCSLLTSLQNIKKTI